MGRKGQLTIIIIILLTLLIGATIIILAQKTKPTNQQPIDPIMVSQVKQFVQLCLEETAAQGIKQWGKQGRLYPSVFLQSGNEVISYYIYKGKGYFPSSLSIVEDEFERYIAEHVDSCINQFPTRNIELVKDPDILRVQVIIDDQVQVRMTYPITITSTNGATKILDSSAVLDYQIKPIFIRAKEIYSHFYYNTNWLDLSLLADDEFPMILHYVNDDTLVITLQGNPSLRFGVKT